MGRFEWFKTKSGVWQGSIISPILFSIIMSEICLEIYEVDTFPYQGGVVTSNRKIQNKRNERIKKKASQFLLSCKGDY